MSKTLYLTAETVLDGTIGVECKVDVPMNDNAAIASALDTFCAFIDTLPLAQEQ